MAVYIEFSESEKYKNMNLRLLKMVEGELKEVGESNDVSANASDMFGLVLFQLIASDVEGINQVVFKAMEEVFDQLSKESTKVEGA